MERMILEKIARALDGNINVGPGYVREDGTVEENVCVRFFDETGTLWNAFIRKVETEPVFD